MAPNFQWIGSPDPEIRSGRAIFFYDADNQRFEIDLPDFSSALALDLFIKAVYRGGKIEGAQAVNWSVQHALRNVMGEM